MRGRLRELLEELKRCKAENAAASNLSELETIVDDLGKRVLDLEGLSGSNQNLIEEIGESLDKLTARVGLLESPGGGIPIEIPEE